MGHRKRIVNTMNTTSGTAEKDISFETAKKLMQLFPIGQNRPIIMTVDIV